MIITPGAEDMRFDARIPVEKGWSADRKYRVTAGGETCLLRISPMEMYERRKCGFENMRRVWDLSVPMCRPVGFGASGEGVYTLVSWIEGEDAEDAIPRLSRREQYGYGREAGEILRRIHTLPAPAQSEAWEARYGRKLDRKLASYAACPVQYEGGQVFIDCIRTNRHLLAGRPQRYQHGDYHIGNMMVDGDGCLVIIDFDRDDYGDPWEEFNRIVWCAQKAPAFASGMVDGYFAGSVPPEFWRLSALYIAGNTLSSLPWAIPFGQDQVSVMLRQASEVLAWYGKMEDSVPAWYGGA